MLVELQPRHVSSAMNVELLQNVVHVILHCRGTETQMARDLFVRKVACDQHGDLSLPACQTSVGKVLQPSPS